MSGIDTVCPEDKEEIDVIEADASRPETIEDRYPAGWKFFLVITSLVCGVLLVAIDNTIIAVAVPKISTEFKALDDVGWYGSAYLLTETALQPPLGNFYKYFDVKFLYLISMVIFEGNDPPFHFLIELDRHLIYIIVGSILCAAAPTSAMFILGRAIAGAGAAGIYQGALCIVGLTVPLEKRAIYLGVVPSSFILATCCGPIIGGVLTSDASWRWCFWI